VQVADPVAGLAEVSAFGVLGGKVVHVHEAADAHRFDEELFGSRKVSHDPGNLAERWGKYRFCHVCAPLHDSIESTFPGSVRRTV
jgi:hypothetical protein